VKTKKSFIRSGWLASGFVCCFLSIAHAQTDVVNIPDPELQSVIRDTLNKPTGDITVADMESVTVLDASVWTRGAGRPAIASLEGLKAARNLRTLNLASTISWMNMPDPTVLSTTNLSAIAALSKLENLDLSCYHYYAPANPSLPAVLSSLTNLQTLVLWLTPLADLSFFTNLTRLRSLDLSNNDLTNMPALTGLTNLEALQLDGNLFTDISFLEGLTGLRSLFIEVDYQVANISLPQGLRNLQELRLSFNSNIQTLTLLEDLPNLATLSLWGNQLTNLSFVDRLPNLRTLDVSYNQLSQVIWPETAARMEYLDVGNNPLTNLSLPASVDLSALTLLGFPKNAVTIRGLWMRQPIRESNGLIRVRISGAASRTVQVERSTNLVNWTPWQTVVLGQNGAELLDDPASAPHRFYRVLGNEFD